MPDGNALPELIEFDRRTGARMAEDVIYARARQAGGQVALTVTLYLPAAGAGAVPGLVWMPPAGAAVAAHGGMIVRRLARQLTSEGLALAVPCFRPAAAEDDLLPATRARLAALAQVPVTPGAEALTGPAVLAAAEDGARFLNWLVARQGVLGLAGRPVLGGRGAGATSAFGVAYLAPWLGIERPDPAGILCYSGGFAWPTLCQAGLCPVFALHNPADEAMPIGPIRALTRVDPGVHLVESFQHDHGALRTHPHERRPDTFGRIRGLMREWADTAGG